MLAMNDSSFSPNLDTGRDREDHSVASTLFRFMIRQPCLFLAFLPTVWIAVAAAGWSKDQLVETEVSEIWVQKRSEYAKDQRYAESYDAEGLDGTGFFALATTRDNGNILTEDRLQELVQRMQITEATTVEHKGQTYTWQDICSLNSIGPGTSYQFPCARISPIDFFQEARWFFREVDRVTWYDEIVRKGVLKPITERIGILQGVCSNLLAPQNTHTECNHVIMLRSSPEYAMANGFPASYADPLGLFADIGTLEMNDPCKMCIETEFENTFDALEAGVRGMFQILAIESVRAIQTATAMNQPVDPKLVLVSENAAKVSSTVTRQQVIDYFSYSTTRGIYASLGAAGLVDVYSAFADPSLMAACGQIIGVENCPANITAAEAEQMLYRHADHAFSSWNSGGIPLPFWSEEANGQPPIMFAGTSPVSGSGVDLSGTAFSTMGYFDGTNYNPFALGTTWNPLYAANATVMSVADPMFAFLVETDPVYKWFVAGVTPADSYCSNEDIPGTMLPEAVPGGDFLNAATGASMKAASPRWCNKHIPPTASRADDDTTVYTVQHFARMWYDLIFDSESFLDVTKGTSDPYVWTLGAACGYDLAGSRAAFTNQTEDTILRNASGQLYYIDEGGLLGPINRNLLLGGTQPSSKDYSPANPLKTVTSLSTLYSALTPDQIVLRVANCNRPGGPIEITEADAEDILYDFKKEFEERWTEGWNDDSAGDLQFVGLFDDSGVAGTGGRLLEEITLDNGSLILISVALLCTFSALFLFDCDLVESRIMVTTIGVALVILAYFSAVGFGLICGIKVNITIGWTLPFIILGLGVDDMYIVLLALKKQGGYTEDDFVEAMKEVLGPVTMTSTVNAAMFAILNISDVPAIYLTARVALIAIIFLYLTIVFCFPAYCWLDMKRQASGGYDILCCLTSSSDRQQERDGRNSDNMGGKNNLANGDGNGKQSGGHIWASFMYDGFYRPVILSESIAVRCLTHALVWLGAGALIGVAIWGLGKREIGLGVEDVFPESHQAKQWALIRTEELASWNIGMTWGALDYTDPDTQMQMVKQFEDVVQSPHVAEMDTDFLWIANLQIWSSRHCTTTFTRQDPTKQVCGRGQIYPKDNSTCSAKWILNTIGRRDKQFPVGDQCVVYDGGICRPTKWMHPDDLADMGETYQGDQDFRSWCPVIDNWDDDKLQFCLGRWRLHTGGGGDLLLLNETGTPLECAGEFENDEVVRVPIPLSKGPSLFAFDLNSHEDTLDLLEETRVFCDDHDSIRCWMNGPPYDFWSQYIGIYELLIELGAAAVGVGFFIAFLALFVKMNIDAHHPTSKILVGSFMGALLISMVTFSSVLTVSGLSFIAGVNLTGLSQVSFVLSVGFAVEYAVHVVSRWLSADVSIQGGVARVEYTMSFLMLPTFMSFVSSVIGISCLAFTEFEFNEIFFFRPMIIVAVVTYFFGCWWLPCVLTLLDFEFLRLGADHGDGGMLTVGGIPAKSKVDPDGEYGNTGIPATTGLGRDNSSSEEDVAH